MWGEPEEITWYPFLNADNDMIIVVMLNAVHVTYLITKIFGEMWCWWCGILVIIWHLNSTLIYWRVYEYNNYAESSLHINIIHIHDGHYHIIIGSILTYTLTLPCIKVSCIFWFYHFPLMTEFCVLDCLTWHILNYVFTLSSRLASCYFQFTSKAAAMLWSMNEMKPIKIRYK